MDLIFRIPIFHLCDTLFIQLLLNRIYRHVVVVCQASHPLRPLSREGLIQETTCTCIYMTDSNHGMQLNVQPCTAVSR